VAPGRRAPRRPRNRGLLTRPSTARTSQPRGQLRKPPSWPRPRPPPNHHPPAPRPGPVRDSHPPRDPAWSVTPTRPAAPARRSDRLGGLARRPDQLSAVGSGSPVRPGETARRTSKPAAQSICGVYVQLGIYPLFPAGNAPRWRPAASGRPLAGTLIPRFTLMRRAGR
jgi:hypothetical protein